MTNPPKIITKIINEGMTYLFGWTYQLQPLGLFLTPPTSYLSIIFVL